MIILNDLALPLSFRIDILEVKYTFCLEKIFFNTHLRIQRLGDHFAGLIAALHPLPRVHDIGQIGLK